METLTFPKFFCLHKMIFFRQINLKAHRKSVKRCILRFYTLPTVNQLASNKDHVRKRIFFFFKAKKNQVQQT